ncbi:MAG: high frequency lysogenization protein HflD [Mariprofundales bacterium]
MTEARVFALAALLQPVAMVHTIARSGQCDAGNFSRAIHAIFASGHDALAIYDGEIAHLQHGLKLLEQLLDGDIKADRAKPILTYAANLIGLEKQLRHQPAMLETLNIGITRAHKQAIYFDSEQHDNVIAAIAGLYGDTISQLKPRVVVRGKAEFLRQSSNTNRVRTLLLAALRGAHYWHQAGGSHWKLLLGRKRIKKQASELLAGL